MDPEKGKRVTRKQTRAMLGYLEGAVFYPKKDGPIDSLNKVRTVDLLKAATAAVEQGIEEVAVVVTTRKDGTFSARVLSSDQG